MDLRHLRYFVAVAEEGHITRAAERLGIQQPPLSQQIRALERELDVQLLHRLPRGVALTAAGEAFLAEARTILARLGEARLAAQRAARGETGRIGIGFTSSASFHPLVPRTIRAFSDDNPLVGLSLEESGTGELVEAIQTGRIAVAFVRSPTAAATDIAVHSVLTEDMIAVLPT